MDPVTHVASGFLAGRAFKDLLPGLRWIVPFCVLAAWIPDIDNFTSLLGIETYLRHHRGITHSLLGAAVTAAIMTAAARFISRSLTPGKTWGLTFGVILMHIYLDVVTSYGTQILLPFSDARVSLPAVFIIDPFFTLSLIVFIALAYLGGGKKRFFAIVGLAWVFIYPLTSMGVRDGVRGAYIQKLRVEGQSFRDVHVQPDALSPLYWKIIVDTGDAYHALGVNLLSPKVERLAETHPKADDLLDSLARQSDFFATYRWFTDFVVQQDRASDAGREITLSDLRFTTYVPWLRPRLNSGNPPFSVTVRLMPDGTLAGWIWHQRGQETVYQTN